MRISAEQAARIIRQARAQGLIAKAPPPDYPHAPPREPVEIRNEKFWKERAASLAAELADTRHILNEVSGLMERPIDPPKWSLPKLGGRKRRAVGLLTISDIQGGEVVKADQIQGINAFDLHICQERLRRLFSATVEILPRWAADCRLKGIYVPLNGDLVSGDIHEELRRTNALTAQEQVFFVADELAAGLEKLADAFGKVVTIVTPGNHGRSTVKTQAKDTAALNYDTMIGKQLSRHFARDDRVTVIVSPGRDITYDIFYWHVLQTHHDEGGGGGQGFAGPLLPILRKGKAIEWMAAQRRVFYDIMVTGHHHTSANLGKILANGSVPGYNEFAQSIRAAPEPPQQWLALVHEQWCLRERCEIKL
jgi:hypothetical protein